MSIVCINQSEMSIVCINQSELRFTWRWFNKKSEKRICWRYRVTISEWGYFAMVKMIYKWNNQTLLVDSPAQWTREFPINTLASQTLSTECVITCQQTGLTIGLKYLVIIKKFYELLVIYIYLMTEVAEKRIPLTLFSVALIMISRVLNSWVVMNAGMIDLAPMVVHSSRHDQQCRGSAHTRSSDLTNLSLVSLSWWWERRRQ